MMMTIMYDFTSMIGLVAWPPFLYQNYYNDGQATKPIMLVKMCYKLSYVIQGVVNIFDKV